METVIYADSLWLVNFSMDFLALYICGRFLRIPLKPLRLILAAALGGVYGVMASVAEFNRVTAAHGIISIISGGICVFAMVAIGYGIKRLAALKASFTYTAVNVGLGGVMTALYSFAWRSSDMLGIKNTQPSSSVSPLFFGAAALISGGISLAYGKYRDRAMGRRKVSARLTALGCSVDLELLCDSGNLLCEPFGGRPVIVVSMASLSKIIPSELAKDLLNGENEDTFSAMYKLKASYIPVSGVMGKGMLICFCPEEITVDGKALEAAVAIDNQGGDYGGCDGIIPQVLVGT